VREPGSARFVADDIEALIGLDRLEEAETLLARLEERAHKLDGASGLASAARCRGLLTAARGDLDAALASLVGALAAHDRVSLPLDRARTLLALGMTRRRAKQRRAARESLEQALALFDELGARSWAERTRTELGRISGRRASDGELTPTELQIVALAGEGRSNKEIAAAVFLTPKTVETKLSRIYANPAKDFPTDTAELRTNRSGNGKPSKAQVFFMPADGEGLQGVHGVMWTDPELERRRRLPDRLLEGDAGLAGHSGRSSHFGSSATALR
jgi:DNA-binding CsgD family transcriptional regulator